MHSLASFGFSLPFPTFSDKLFPKSAIESKKSKIVFQLHADSSEISYLISRMSVREEDVNPSSEGEGSHGTSHDEDNVRRDELASNSESGQGIKFAQPKTGSSTPKSSCF